MRFHAWLLTLHIAAAAVYVGGSILLNHMAIQARRARKPEAFLKTVQAFSKSIGTGGILTLLTGIGLVVTVESWTFTSLFVLIGLGAVVVSATTESFHFQKRIDATASLVTKRPHSPDIPAHLKRITRSALAVNVLFLFTIWAMVAKPGI